MIRTMVLAAVVVVVCGCSLEASVEASIDESALSPNPCTAVALLTPVSSFTTTVGAPVSLSGSATCPAGQVPEYQFWVKPAGAANWTILSVPAAPPATAPVIYFPGSFQWVPDTTGDWCVSVVTRAVGSADPFQARSSARCGTVSGTAAGGSGTLTLSLPITAPGTFIPSSAVFQGSFDTPISLPVGAHITGIHMLGFDSVSGPTRISVGLRKSDSLGNNVISGAGPASSGDGAIKIVSSAPMDEVIVSGTLYACEAFVVSGVASCAVHSCEVDYRMTGATVPAGQTPVSTIVVPVVPPTVDFPHNALYALVQGIGSGSHQLVVPLSLSVGQTIRALRVRVLDGGTGTTVQTSLMIARDNAQAFSTVFTSPPSLGLGVEETIGVTSAAIPVDPATQYFVTVFTSAGALVSNVYRLEVDVN